METLPHSARRAREKGEPVNPLKVAINCTKQESIPQGAPQKPSPMLAVSLGMETLLHSARRAREKGEPVRGYRAYRSDRAYGANAKAQP